jgi:hypothetical protein
MLVGFHDPLDMVVVQSMTLVNDCDVMTLVVGLPLTDKSKGSSWNTAGKPVHQCGDGHRNHKPDQ